MYSDIDEQVTIERDCEATLIPFGNKITLKKGEEGHITQALGGSYTVMIGGNLFRIDGNDADAIGKEKPEPAQKSNDIDSSNVNNDLAGPGLQNPLKSIKNTLKGGNLWSTNLSVSYNYNAYNPLNKTKTFWVNTFSKKRN